MLYCQCGIIIAYMLKNIEDFLKTIPWISVAILVFVGLRRPKRIWPFAVTTIVLLTAIFVTGEFLSYLDSRDKDLAKYFYPPYSHDYLSRAFHAFSGIYSGWIAAGVLGAMLYLLFIRIGKENLLDRRDIWLMVLGAVCVGWPGLLVFLGFIFGLSILGMMTLVIMKKKTLHDRLIITPFIVPAAVLTLFTSSYLLTITNLYKIRF